MSEYSELVKRLDKVRSYVRDFYLYGFKSRDDFTQKSGRTYDNERRRAESWWSMTHWDWLPPLKSKKECYTGRLPIPGRRFPRNWMPLWMQSASTKAPLPSASSAAPF